MKTGIILKIIGVFLVIAIAGLILHLTNTAHPFGYFMLAGGLLAGKIFGLILLLRYGSLKKTVYWKIIKFLIGFVIIGVMFKISHFPKADFILTFSLMAIAVVYTISFLKKPRKKHLDFLKVIWALLTFIGTALILQKWISKDWQFITTGIFWLTFLDFMITEIRSKWFGKNKS